MGTFVPTEHFYIGNENNRKKQKDPLHRIKGHLQIIWTRRDFDVNTFTEDVVLQARDDVCLEH